MRSLPDDIPCNLVLVREPEQDTVPRHMRLPSYGAMVTKQREEERLRDLLAWQNSMRKLGAKTEQREASIQRFNGNNDPHITEANCRKPKISGNTVGQSAAPSIATTTYVSASEVPKAPRPFAIGDRIISIDRIGGTWLGAGERGTVTKLSEAGNIFARFDSAPQLEFACTHWIAHDEAAPQQSKADPEGWIQHDGKGCPLPLGTKYEARRTGWSGRPFCSTVEPVDIARGSLWFDISDVTAYRMVA